jgi:hypothetical protein
LGKQKSSLIKELFWRRRMAETFLLVLGFCYFIYISAIKVPKDIKKVEDKVDLLQLQLKEINLKLSQMNKKKDI